MPSFRCRFSITEAVRWFKNGDHPSDNCKMFLDSDGTPFSGEGKVVRYFRDPSTDPNTVCHKCGYTMHKHGFLDVPPNGFAVCPGDWIVTGFYGGYQRLSDAEFRATYEAVEGEEKAKHEHTVCAHLHLLHCPVCDVVYCQDCDLEWTAAPRFFWQEPQVSWQSMPCGTGAPVKEPDVTITCEHAACNCGGTLVAD